MAAEQNLLVRITEVGKKKVLILCNEAGVPLPNQIEITIHEPEYGENKFPSITVKFDIDGRLVRFD